MDKKVTLKAQSNTSRLIKESESTLLSVSKSTTLVVLPGVKQEDVTRIDLALLFLYRVEHGRIDRDSNDQQIEKFFNSLRETLQHLGFTVPPQNYQTANSIEESLEAERRVIGLLGMIAGLSNSENPDIKDIERIWDSRILRDDREQFFGSSLISTVFSDQNDRLILIIKFIVSKNERVSSNFLGLGVGRNPTSTRVYSITSVMERNSFDEKVPMIRERLDRDFGEWLKSVTLTTETF